MKYFRLAIFWSLLCLYITSNAQETNGLTFSGYVDLYYAFDFSEPNNNQRQYVTQAARHNEFNLNMALLAASYSSDKVRATFAIHTGTYPATNYSAEPNDLARMINAANVGFKLGMKSWIDVGIMGGHFGYESVLSTDNALVTQALATEYTPYYQTGIQLTTQINKKVAFKAVVLNGWQNIYETNQSKSVGIAFDYKISENWSASYGNYFGKDPVSGLNRLRLHHNAYVSYQGQKYNSALVVDYMQEGLNFDLPEETDLLFITWIQQYQLTDPLSIGLRYERVSDPTNVLLSSPTGNFQANIVTAAVRYKVSTVALVSLEAKSYFGSENIWVKNNSTLTNQNAILNASLTLMIGQ